MLLHCSDFVPNGNAVDHMANRAKQEKNDQSRGKPSGKAVKQIDELFTDPIVRSLHTQSICSLKQSLIRFIIDHILFQKFSSNGHASTNDSEIVVKTKRSAVVEREEEVDEMPCDIEIFQIAISTNHFTALKIEKENIIKDLVTIEEENLKLTLQLQPQQRKFDILS